MTFYQELEQRIATAMQSDRHRLRNMLRAVQQAEDAGKPPDERLDRLLTLLDESNRKREARQSLVPSLVYDESLPVVARREEIAAAIRDHQVVVVSGETGSGKSTQLPKICLEIGRGIGGMIGHTQPRRIAARSIAARIADELGTTVGQKVGFKIRFADATGPETLVKVMTDGVLLAESQHDRYFDHYDTLIIDEAHERSLNIDFLLGYLKRLLPKRPELRVIITSATIDAQRFAEHLADDGREVPVIEVTGLTYPVEVLYRPLVDEESDEKVDPIRGVADAVEEVCRLGAGDVLVFLPTERDILEAAHKLRGRHLSGGRPDILPLYARLSTAEQNKVFHKHSGRRIVLATNVAESSLTVPGIRFVIDTGTARVSRYSPRSKVQRLPIERVSQASADQRKGRCGRVGPGVCVRLFSEDDYLSRDKFTSPEIQRTNLAAVILQLAALDLGPIDEFPFLDPPRAEAIRDGYKTLFELGAISEGQTDRWQLTALGRQLARLPVDPRIGRMILEADREHCLADVLIIGAALSVQDPRVRPADRQQNADAAHSRWADADSDFLGWLRLWDFVQHLKEQTSRNQFRKACQQHFLSEMRLREWHDVHRQLLEMARQFGLNIGRRKWLVPQIGAKPDASETTAYAAIHRALVSGLLSSIAMRGDTGEYIAVGGGKFQLWPGSGIYASKPKWIVAGEMVETTRRYLRTVARIDPQWIESLATHLVTRNHSEPHWDSRAGAAMASEKVSLFGLTIVPRRRVRYTSIGPRESRRLFIEHGLAEGDFATKAEFFRHNRQLVDDIVARAVKTRRRDLIIEPQDLIDFYEARVPASVVDAATFERWRREAEKTNRRLLFLEESDLLEQPETAAVTAGAFPDELQIDRLKLPLEYHFEPGAERDGLTVTVPREGLAQLSDERLGWLIPGLLEDKIQALIKVLPKSVRQQLGPAPDIARKVLKEVSFAKGPFLTSLAAALSRHSREPVRAEMFELDRLPPYLRMNVRVVDEQGATVAEGRDLNELRQRVGVVTPQEIAPKDSPWHRNGITKWDFGALPDSVKVRYGGLTLTKFPALVDAGDSTALRLLDTSMQAAEATRRGATRLFAISERRELKTQVHWLPGLDKLKLRAAPLTKDRSLDEQLMDLVALRAFYQIEQVPRDADAFETQRLLGRRHIVPAVHEVTKLIGPLLEAYHEARLALEERRPDTWQYALDDMREQLALLTGDNFLITTPWPWLLHYPRYLKGIARRAMKLGSGGLAKDQAAHQQIRPRWEAFFNRLKGTQQHILEADAVRYRWLLEEMRVSLFAQELGTSAPVSPQRLDKLWAQIGL